LACRAFRYFFQYFFYFFSWLSLPALAGLVSVLRQKNQLNRKQKNYTYLFGVVTVYLLFFYGSWYFVDNINHRVSLGTAFVRYWLPVYVMSLPFIAWFVLRFLSQKSRWIFTGLCFFMALFVSFGPGEESLSSIFFHIREYRQIRERVLPQIPIQAVVLTDRSDKIFFPARHVIVKADRSWDEIADICSRLIQERFPVYYWTRLKEKDTRYLSLNWFESRGVFFEKILNRKDFNLFKMNLFEDFYDQ